MRSCIVIEVKKILSYEATSVAKKAQKTLKRLHTGFEPMTSAILVRSQAAQAQGGLGSSCCITQDYKEMYWDFNDLGKSYDLIMKLEINVLYL